MTQLNRDQYPKRLPQITRKLRRILDPDQIWQETVEGLGDALNISICIICPYKKFSQQVPVVAEYRQPPCPSMLGQLLSLTENPFLTQALETLEPVWLEQIQPSDRLPCQSILAIATPYQNHPNGLILLCQCDQTRHWSEVEIAFIEEVADQVGYAIAHANLYQELEETRQQAQEAIRLKQEFLGTISHELRTPLNGMIGFLQLILDDVVDEPDERMEFTREAYTSALRLFNIINDILDLTQIETHPIELDLEPVHLDELLNDVKDYTQIHVQQKHLSLKIKPSATYDGILLYANYQRLLQVMLNLVGNSIKFTNEGSITISTKVIKKKVTIHQQELPGFGEIRVEDTGIGVPLDKLNKIFEVFTKADGTRTGRHGGTGLGLSISQKLVEAMGGEINFFTMGEGLGSTVTFTVPLYQEPVMISKPKNKSIRVLTPADI